MIELDNKKIEDITTANVQLIQQPEFNFLIPASKLAELPPMEWLIDGVLPRPSLTVLFGAPAVGKTFMMLDLALSVATGTSWQGLPTQQGKVVIVEAEGKGNLAARCDAWLHANNQPKELFEDNVFFVLKSCQFMKENDVNRLIDDLKMMPEPPALLVIDTLARCTVGAKENDTGDMGIFMDYCSKVSQTFGTTVLILHHTLKNEDMYRGSTAIEGAADSMIAMVKHTGGSRLHSFKQKDGLPFSDMFFRLENEPISGSAYVVRTDFVPSARRSKVDVNSNKIIAAFEQKRPLTYTEALRASGIGDSTFSRKLRLLVDKGILVKTGNSYDLPNDD